VVVLSVLRLNIGASSAERAEGAGTRSMGRASVVHAHKR